MDLARYLLLMSHGISMWDNSLWSFAIGVYLVILFPGSLTLSAIYGLILAISILLFGSTVGFWIDHTPRLRGGSTSTARIALLVKNGSVVICCTVLCILLTYSKQWETEGHQTWILVAQIMVVLIADVASVASEGQRIILERDWIVVISGHKKEDLAKMNSLFRSIDLVARVLAPTIAGAVMSLVPPVVSAVSLAALNLMSLVVEFLLLGIIFKKVPELRHRHLHRGSGKTETPAGLDDEEIPAGVPVKKLGWLKHSTKAWKMYLVHPVFPAGFGLSLLYMTVLGFDNVTTGYMYSQRVPEWLIGAITGVGSIFGVLGALLFPFIRARCGLVITAIIGYATLNTLTSGAIVASFIPGSPFEVYPGHDETGNSNLPVMSNPSIITFMICIVAGRAGLWTADLAVMQIMQEGIKPDLRGKLNGVQTSMNNLFEVLKFGLVTALPTPPVFGYLIIMSECFTVSGEWEPNLAKISQLGQTSVKLKLYNALQAVLRKTGNASELFGESSPLIYRCLLVTCDKSMELTRYLLLLSHGTSMWDNSLWSFAIGVYLVILFPESLALTAIYGLILAASILIFGSTIGFWIDHTPRLKGYLYSQGVPEWLLGVTTGAGSIFGVIGAIVYPFIRSRCG
ncbi:unnamed protein product, partial [Notodromas monacha]